MSNRNLQNRTVVRTSRGLTIHGTRLTIYALMDHFKAGDSDDLVREWYRLSADELADIHRYIDEHRDEVEREYQEVVRRADQRRQQWEQKNQGLWERLRNAPLPPEAELQRARLEELRRQRSQS